MMVFQNLKGKEGKIFRSNNLHICELESKKEIGGGLHPHPSGIALYKPNVQKQCFLVIICLQFPCIPSLIFHQGT